MFKKQNDLCHVLNGIRSLKYTVSQDFPILKFHRNFDIHIKIDNTGKFYIPIELLENVRDTIFSIITFKLLFHLHQVMPL